MSSALVRQALEFVDPEENDGKRNKRKGQPHRPGASGQVRAQPNKQIKKPKQKEASGDTTDENIKKLLALSAPSVDKKVAKKIIERAIKGKPLEEKIEVKKDDGKSILFPN